MGGGTHLVSRVKEGQQAPLLHNLEDALPLVGGGVHPCGVVGTGMQQHHRALGSAAQVLTHALHMKKNKDPTNFSQPTKNITWCRLKLHTCLACEAEEGKFKLWQANKTDAYDWVQPRQ